MSQGFATNFSGTINYVSNLAKETKDADFTLAVQTSYSTDHATPATLLNGTMPATAVEGDEVEVVLGDNTGGTKVKVNPTHLKPIRINGSVSLSTSSGFWTGFPGAAMRLRYFASENAWVAVGVVGQWTNDAGVVQHAADSTRALPIGAPTDASHAVRLADLGGETFALIPSFYGQRAIGAISGASTTNHRGHLLLSKDSTTFDCFFVSLHNLHLYHSRSTNAGVTWSTPVDTGIIPDSLLEYSAYVNGDELCAIYADSSDADIKAVRSANGGATWSSAVTVSVQASGTATLGLDGFGSTIYAVYSVNNTALCKVSTDNGATWGTERTANGNGLSVDKFKVISASTAYMWSTETGSTVFSKTTDTNGSNWTEVAVSASVVYTALAMVVHSSSEIDVVALRASNDTLVLWRTTDSGATWTLTSQVAYLTVEATAIAHPARADQTAVIPASSNPFVMVFRNSSSGDEGVYGFEIEKDQVGLLSEVPGVLRSVSAASVAFMCPAGTDEVYFVATSAVDSAERDTTHFRRMGKMAVVA